MGKPHSPVPEANEAKRLVRLCRAARPYEIEKWINDGKSLAIAATINRGRYRSFPGIAV
jgi:hypothetical protein